MSVDAPSALPLYTGSRATTRIAAALCVLTAAVGWAAAGYDLGELVTAFGVGAGESLERGELAARTRVGSLVAIAQWTCAVLLALGFVAWLYQMRANVRAFGARRLRFGREWTWLGALVPGLNLVRPFQVVSEVWRASDPGVDDPVGWRERRTPPLVWAWWLGLWVWLASEAFSGLLLGQASSLARIQLAHALALVGDVCAALAASAGYLLVVRVASAQRAKWSARVPTGN